MNAWRLHFFLFVALNFSYLAFADLTIGQPCPLQLVDVDSNKLSLADGRITMVVLTPQSQINRAHTVGERTPDHCLGNPTYQMITVVTFEKHSAPVRALLNSIVRHRVNSEAQELQKRYDQLKIGHNARPDVHVVADFDGGIATKLGAPSDASAFRVFVFGKNGELLKKWDDAPEAAQLAEALK